MFLEELKKFSKENWWVYLLLAIALIIVSFSWNQSSFKLLEIILLFIANLLWNLFIMVMQWNYTAKNNKIWAIYHILSVTIFTITAIYWALILEQTQYIIWQICYILAALKAFSYYNFWKNFKLLNSITLSILNILLFIVFIYMGWKEVDLWIIKLNINVWIWSILMAIWFSLVTTWLVSINDKIRYWLNILWVVWIVIWSGIIWFYSYVSWNLDSLAVWYFILTSTVLVYYCKLLPEYIKKKNK